MTRFLSSGAAINDAERTTYLASVTDERVPTDGTAEFPTLSYGTGDLASVRGGAVTIGLDSPVPLSRIFVGVEGQPGRYEIDLTRAASLSADRALTASHATGPAALAGVAYLTAPPAARVSGQHVDVILTLPEDSSLASFKLQMVVEHGAASNMAAVSAGARSRVRSWSVDLLDDGGVPRALSFALSWGVDVDVDLHVVTASGNRIGYDRPAAEGGRLSVDANAGCGNNHDRAEKIEWSGGPAPQMGVYRAGPNYYEACDGYAGQIAVTLVINNGRFFQRYYRFALGPGDENHAARLDVARSIYLGVLPPKDTEPGLLARLLVSENPPAGAVPRDELKRGMQAVQAVVYNRFASHDTRITGAASANASLSQVITAHNQFQGFSDGMNAATERKVDERMTVLVPAQDVSRGYWDDLFAVLAGPGQDPFATLDKIGTTSVRKGAWAMYATSGLPQRPSGPGGSYVAIPAAQGGVIAGNQFYTLPSTF